MYLYLDLFLYLYVYLYLFLYLYLYLCLYLSWPVFVAVYNLYPHNLYLYLDLKALPLTSIST